MRIPLSTGRTACKCLLSVVATCVFAWGAHADGESTERSELSTLLRAENNARFELATEPRSFEFPRDHGPHPEFRNEWWYVTGNLDATDGRRFGFELTIFRFALTPDALASNSAWRSNQVFIAHFAVTDVDGGDFYVAQRFSRGALGLAGTQAEPFRVWVDDWEIAAADNLKRREHWQLEASGDDFALSLQLVAEKSPVLNGDNGLSQKSADVGNASYYYSITRWQTDGHLRLGKDETKVSGLSWLDREWSSSALAAGQKGWDWFALQLSDGSEMMFYNLRKADGTQDVHSGGTWVAADGQSRHLNSDEASVLVTKEWESPEGGTYPSAWDIHAPGLGLSLAVTPILDDQELFTTVRYWEGAVDVTGTRNGAEVIGRGYVELTGYAD